MCGRGILEWGEIEFDVIKMLVGMMIFNFVIVWDNFGDLVR